MSIALLLTFVNVSPSAIAAELAQQAVIPKPSQLPLPRAFEPHRQDHLTKPRSSTRQTISIKSPANESTIRGPLKLDLAIEPPLTGAPRLEILIDGVVAYEGVFQASLALPALTRGQHRIRARIQNEADGSGWIAISKETRIYVQQSSRLLPGR